MFNAAADELSEWAERCRRWAKDARSREQRLTLQSLEKLLNDAALDAESGAECDRLPQKTQLVS